jgi:hypothetical protein
LWLRPIRADRFVAADAVNGGMAVLGRSPVVTSKGRR